MSNTKSMAAWLSTEHPELEDALGDALKAADRQYAASQPGYGKSGDALAGAGLLDSGYAAYLAGIAYATDQIIDLYANGITHVHVYTMNKPDVAAGIQKNLSEILGKSDD